MKLLLALAAGVLLAAGCQQSSLSPALAPERQVVVAPAEGGPVIADRQQVAGPRIEGPAPAAAAAPPRERPQPAAAQPQPALPAVVAPGGCSAGGRPPRECPPG